MHPCLTTSAGQAGTVAPPARLRHLSLGITPLRRHTPASRPCTLMLLQGSEGLTRPRLARVLTPPNGAGQGNSLPTSRGSPQGRRGGPVSAGGVRTALPAACCCLGWAPPRLHRRYLPNYSYFPAVGRIQAQIPPVPAQPFPASLLGWEHHLPPPCLQPPRPGHPAACPGLGTQLGTPCFAPTMF